MTVREILAKFIDLHDILSMKDYKELADVCKIDPTADKFFDGEEE